MGEKRACIFFLNKLHITKKWDIHCFLYHKAQLQFWVQLLWQVLPSPSQYRKDINKLWQVHWWVTKSGPGALWGGAGWAGPVQPGEEAALGAPKSSPCAYEEGAAMTEPGSSCVLGTLQKQKASLEARKMHSYCKERVFAYRELSRLLRILSP